MRRLVLLGVVALAVTAGVERARAATPTARLDRSAASIGERVTVILEGWPAQRTVTITACGNAARRGSVDCAITRSQGYGVSAFDKVHATSFEVVAPPAPCPCVIQVANSTFSEVAYAPIDIVDHATGAVVAGAVDAPIAVEFDVRPARQGAVEWLRSALGGPTRYELRARVRNRVGEALTDLDVTARAGRLGDDQVRSVRFVLPKVLPANQTWTGVELVTLPAPGIGAVDWTLTATGAGPTMKETSTTRQRPMLFIALVVALVVDLGWYAKRRLTRRRRRERYA